MKKIHLVRLGFLSVLVSAISVSSALSARAEDGDGVRLLMVGDSHSAGTFGQTVDQALRDALPKAKVTFYAASSATPDYYSYGTSSHGGFFQHFATGKPVTSTPAEPDKATPTLSALLKQSQATVTVVALSTNLLRASLDTARAQVMRAIQAIKDKGSQCIWVGGPDERFVTRKMQADLYDILKSATDEGGCLLIDSRKYTHYPDVGGGGIHYDDIWVKTTDGKMKNVGATMAAEWGKEVTADILGVVNGVEPSAGPSPAK